MRPHIPFLRPSLVPWRAFQHHLDSIDETHLYSNYGPLNTTFETRVITEGFQGVGAASTVANATLGLMLAIAEVKRPRGRFAVMPSFTFAATALAAQWCGLEPFFVDTCPDTWCMDPAQLEVALERLGDEAAVVIPYATFGTVMDLDPFRRLHERGVPVVVDAAPCFGAENDDGYFGLGFPGVVVFSFHATKAFCVGEGGLVYSGDAEAIARIRRAGNFGFSTDRESIQLGLNSKMSEYIAAIALATLDRFPQKVAERQKIHQWYLDEMEQRCPSGDGWATQAYTGRVPWQFMSTLCPEGTRESRLARMKEAGIECRTYFSPPCHRQAQFADCRQGDLSVTEQLSRRIVSLPLWEGMERKDVGLVVQVLAE